MHDYVSKYISILQLSICAAALVLSTSTYAEEPTIQWAFALGGEHYDQGRAVAVDREGSVYVTGRFSGAVDFDPGPELHILTASTSEIYVCKYTAAGSLAWARAIGGPHGDFSYAIAVDSTGNTYITGHFGVAYLPSWADFDPGPEQQLLHSAYAGDLFVCKLNPAGEFLWAHAAGGQDWDLGRAIAVGADDSVYLTGSFSGTIDLDPGNEYYPLTAHRRGSFVLKLGPTGDFAWAHALEAEPMAITVSNHDHLFIAGTFAGRISFAFDNTEVGLTSTGWHDAFVLKLRNDGAIMSAWKVGGQNSEYGRALTVSRTGDVFIGGECNDESDFDPGPGVATVGTPWHRAYICKLDAEGGLVWVRGVGSIDGLDSIRSIAVDSRGSVFAAGHTTRSVDLDPSPAYSIFNEIGGYDGFLVKLSDSGNYEWGGLLGGPSEDHIDMLVLDRHGAACMTGSFSSFSSVADLNPGPGNFESYAEGEMDAFVVRLQSPGHMIHSADSNADVTISLSELLRVVQLYSVGSFGCAGLESEDGFRAMLAPRNCAPHDTDYMSTNWSISLEELMRLLQLYNADGYHVECGTEDGFAPGREKDVFCESDADRAASISAPYARW